MAPLLLFIFRCTIALVWLYNGLYLKIIAGDAHHLKIVEATGLSLGLNPSHLLLLIGIGETFLGLGVLTGLWHRFIACFQIVLLSSMNTVGILYGQNSIEDPAKLIIGNLPLVLCMMTVGIYGPGAYAWKPGPAMKEAGQ